MKSSSAAGASLFLVFASLTCAEESSLIGRYTGTVDMVGLQRQNVPVGLTLVIHKASGGQVEATGQMAPLVGTCTGEFPMVGKVDGNELRLRNAKPFGQTGECNLVLRLTAKGPQLIGTAGRGLPVQLAR